MERSTPSLTGEKKVKPIVIMVATHWDIAARST